MLCNINALIIPVPLSDEALREQKGGWANTLYAGISLIFFMFKKLNASGKQKMGEEISRRELFQSCYHTLDEVIGATVPEKPYSYNNGISRRVLMKGIFGLASAYAILKPGLLPALSKKDTPKVYSIQVATMSDVDLKDSLASFLKKKGFNVFESEKAGSYRIFVGEYRSMALASASLEIASESLRKLGYSDAFVQVLFKDDLKPSIHTESITEYNIQVGAFSRKEILNRLESVLKSSGYRVAKERQGDLTRLLAGSFKTEEEAESSTSDVFALLEKEKINQLGIMGYDSVKQKRQWRSIITNKEIKSEKPYKHPVTKKLSRDDIRKIILHEVSRYNRVNRPDHPLDPIYVEAILKVESNYNPCAVGYKLRPKQVSTASGKKKDIFVYKLDSKGKIPAAYGLMMLTKPTAEYLQIPPGSLFEPRANIRGGVKYLGRLLEMFDGNHLLAAAAYNCGPAAVNGGRKLYPETVDYVRKVRLAYTSLKSAG